MILVYNYEKAMHVIDLFNKNQIVTIKVCKSDSIDNFIFEYSTVEEYEDKDLIAKQFSKNTVLNTRIAVLTLLNEFVLMMSIKKVSNFNLKFDLMTNEIEWIKSYNVTSEAIAPENRLEVILFELEDQISRLGLGKLEISEVYEKANIEGKKAKYNPITFEDLISKLRKIAAGVDNG